VYDPQRILYPMKREGERGEGKWQQISWTDALEEIANRLINIRNGNRDNEFVFQANGFHLHGLISKFLEAYGEPTLISAEPWRDVNKTFAQKITWGEDVEINDVENTRLMLNFGANPFESHPFFINFSQRIIKAKLNNGAKLITIDPRLSNTAGKSDQWIPIKPGTDAIVALTMANVILQNNLYDNEFISRWTNISVSDLKTYLAEFTLEEAERQSTVSAEIIKKLALDFATIKPSLAFSGSGVTKHINGTQNERCVMLLNAIVGNIDTKGGVCLPRRFKLDHFSTNGHHYNDAANLFNLIEDGKKKVDTYISYNSNPVYEYPENDNVLSIMKNSELIPYSVAITTVMSETASVADLVLPTTTYMESWNLNSNPAFELKPFVALGQPVIAPRGESRSLNKIAFYLSRIIGGDVETSVNYKSVKDFIKEIASRVSGFTLSESFEQLTKTGIWLSSNHFLQYKSYTRNGFNTSSGRFEINSRYLQSKGISSLPQYLPIREHLNLSKDELILIPYATNVLTEDLANSKWLSELRHENFALINPKTARSLKLRQGSKIKLQSSIGEIEIKIRITATIHPKAIAISKGLGHWEFGKIAQAQKFKSEDPDTELLWWSKKGNGVNPNFVVVVASDPLGKGQAWKDTKVRVIG